MEGRIKAITDKTASLTAVEKPNVFITIFPGYYSAGSDSLINELLVKAGGVNIVGELTGFPVMSLEAIIDANPQVMLASIGHGSGEDTNLQELLDEERLAGVDARLDGRVHGIIGDIINKGTPRIVDGLEEMARLLHPGLFE
jgi:iron complex transport system substrate-binding protein